jgi:hypothetical protein
MVIYFSNKTCCCGSTRARRGKSFSSLKFLCQRGDEALSFIAVTFCPPLHVGKAMGQEEEWGQGGEQVALEEIGQLIVSMGLTWREARHRAKKATTPTKGYFKAATHSK